VDWTATETALGEVLTAYKSGSNVHLDWTAYAPTGESYVVRRKQVPDPEDKNFDGAVAIATIDGTKTYDDPVVGSGIRYDYRVFKRVKSDAMFFYHTDHLGTPIAMTSGSSVVMWRAEHLPFGGLLGDEPVVEDIENNLRFPGQYFDAESGLNFNDYRELAPQLGRYSQSDPIGILGGTNGYSYVAGNPTNRIDRFGLDWIEYTGERLRLYWGDPGDRRVEIRTCDATSGLYEAGVFDYRNPAYQSIKGGPVPGGWYSVNLRPSPNRVAEWGAGGETIPSIGIQRVEGSPDWGSWRARLEPRSDTVTHGRTWFYLHNSHKGYTSGCVETCDALLDDLNTWRSMGNSHIDVFVNYVDPTTNGRTKR
jgi:RHS repeat-associated protein